MNKPEYHQTWYNKNKETRRQQIYARREEILAWVKEYKKTLSCQVCGETHPATLDFHHKDPRTKDGTIRRGVANGWSIERVQAEIEKCDVLCANCHRKHHHEDKF